MSYARRKDGNHRLIVAGLSERMVSVLETYQLGDGAPDFIAGTRGVSYLFEVKDESKPLSKQKLTPAQVRFHREWRGSRVHVIRNLGEALQVLGLT